MKPMTLLYIIASIFLFAASAQAVQPFQNLNKIGEGSVYYLGFIKVYDAELYTSDFQSTSSVLSDDVSKCLHLMYDVDITKDIFVDAAQTVLERQFTSEQLSRVQRQIDMIHQGYQDVEEGDTYTLCYDDASRETTLALNNSVIVSADSAEFAQVYFSIWLGDRQPLDDDLRDDLLSR